MADPTQTGLFGHRWGAYIKNETSGSEIWADRVQRVEPTVDLRTTPYYELGRVGKIGVTQDPASFRFTAEQNLANHELAYVLAGKNPNPTAAQTFQLGDFIGKNITAYALGRDEAGTIDREVYLTNLRLTELSYRFTIRDAIATTFGLQGTVGRWYTSGSLIHTAWGTLDDTSPGGVHGKEARVWFNTSGSTAASRAFRLQSFGIRAMFPVTPVAELGRRDLVGQLADSPDVTVDLDVLASDFQPLDKFFAAGGGHYDLNTPAALFDGYVRVFDPDLAEALSVISSFKLENLRLTSGTPMRAQVRGLSTMRYSLTVAKESTTDSGGLIVSNRNQ